MKLSWKRFNIISNKSQIIIIGIYSLVNLIPRVKKAPVTGEKLINLK
jgi:hypothetical protein